MASLAAAPTWRPEVVVLTPEPDGGLEARLVARAQGGDVAAFEALYRRHVPLVHAVCRRMTRDGRRAEELTQEVFIRAWQKLASFRGEAAFATWLTRLAVNVVLSERRRVVRHEGREDATDDLEEVAPAATGAHPGERLDLERAVAALPRGARNVLVLHDVHGFHHAEIAAMLGLAVGTCKAQLHRARKLLREALSW
jgi:RNA polymerase sigma-70 factor, ECF subfamily